MVSSRLMRKDLGGRPQSLAGRQLIKLFTRGCPLGTAARQVEISRSAAYLRRFGPSVRYKNVSFRHVAPLLP